MLRNYFCPKQNDTKCTCLKGNFHFFDLFWTFLNRIEESTTSWHALNRACSCLGVASASPTTGSGQRIWGLSPCTVHSPHWDSANLGIFCLALLFKVKSPNTAKKKLVLRQWSPILIRNLSTYPGVTLVYWEGFLLDANGCKIDAFTSRTRHEISAMTSHISPWKPKIRRCSLAIEVNKSEPQSNYPQRWTKVLPCPSFVNSMKLLQKRSWAYVRPPTHWGVCAKAILATMQTY